MSNKVPPQPRASDLEVISAQVEDEPQRLAPVPLVSFAYRDLPLDMSLAGSQLISNPDEDDNRDGSDWLKPCCGHGASLWHVCLLSAGFNCFLVLCVIVVVLLLTLELLIDTTLLQFHNAVQFACVIHWISLAILSVFFTETVFRIVVLGIWDYIENKVEVFDGAVIVLSLAPMVASTVANGPGSPWDAIGLIVTLRIWRVKRIIDAYVLQVKVELELEIQQFEKAKAIREEQLERLTHICQEQAFEIRQLRAHLAQQDLDLSAEREAALQMHRLWGKRNSSFQEVDEPRGPTRARGPGEATDHSGQDDMNNYISQYYSEPSSDMGVPDPAARVITTAAIDVHLPTNPSQLPSTLVSAEAMSSGRLHPTESSVSEASSIDCSSTVREASTSTDYPPPYSSPLVRGSPSAVVQELLSSLSEHSCLTQKGLDPVNLKPPSPTGSTKSSPEMEHRLNIYNKNQERALHGKALIQVQSNEPLVDEKHRLMEPVQVSLKRLSKT
ncbi:transmembrane protein 266 [Periophthalmus magnuspinnatus]|uniref:transmembrane protein 266 n=1 Tax=Periophthalmus magnuspinnatus TaxID=409849 RepID=UPI00145B1A5A|nr:transmembrane protein 266 [Periophthalmus magnuspinnatus]